MRRDAIAGCLLGTAVGDAIGLPYEGLSPARARRILGPPTRHRLVFGRGMVSDDTEHAVMVAQSLIASRADPARFAGHLARRLRLWLLGLPAGVGLATLRAAMKLWIGFPPGRSGVFSAGNGPAMRAPLLGVSTSDPRRLPALVDASTRITHTDPRAFHGALAVALASHVASRGALVSPDSYVDQLSRLLPVDSAEFLDLLSSAARSLSRGQSTEEFARSLGLHRGVSGFVYHCVPVCIHAWLSSQDSFPDSVRSVIRCGGDADSTGAIVGGIVGSYTGRGGIPTTWVDHLWEWPWTVTWLEKLAETVHDALSTDGPVAPPRSRSLERLPRNLFFLAVVLAHGLRRLVPPY